jgi:hypothetical protein
MASVWLYADTQASTIAERAGVGMMSMPVCHQLIGEPSGSQPPDTGK